MANDRMFLRCPCGGTAMIAKHLGQAWYTLDDVAGHPSLADRLDAWFLDHATCGPFGEYPARPWLVLESDT